MGGAAMSGGRMRERVLSCTAGWGSVTSEWVLHYRESWEHTSNVYTYQNAYKLLQSISFDFLRTCPFHSRSRLVSRWLPWCAHFWQVLSILFYSLNVVAFWIYINNWISRLSLYTHILVKTTSYQSACPARKQCELCGYCSPSWYHECLAWIDCRWEGEYKLTWSISYITHTEETLVYVHYAHGRTTTPCWCSISLPMTRLSAHSLLLLPPAHWPCRWGENMILDYDE